MRNVILRLGCAGLLGLALAMVLTACLSPAVPSQVPNPPGTLHVEITIRQESPTGTSASIAVKFFDANSNFIEFAAGETIACNGTFLAFHDDAFLGLHVDAYTGQVPMLPAGAHYTCVYTIPDGTKATILVPAQKPLVLLSPKPGATLAIPKKTHTLSFTCTPANGSSLSGLARDSQGHEALGKPEHDAGSYTLDDTALSAFAPGAGTVSLTRTWASAPSGTGFQSVKVAYELTSTLQVTWV